MNKCMQAACPYNTFEGCKVNMFGGICPMTNMASPVVSEDNVNHPSHYETGRFECIDVMVETQGVEAVKNFCICNAFKYLYRHKNKNGIEDVKKAIWYLNKLLQLEGGETS